jgi:hypothetical protein
MQPARLPLALLAVALLAALVSVVDRADGGRYGARGLGGGELTEFEVRQLRQRARNAVLGIGAAEVAELESADGGRDADEIPLAAFRDAARRGADAARERIVARELDAESRDAALGAVQSSLVSAMRALDAADPKGVASAFVDDEIRAAREVVTGIVRLDADAALGGIVAMIALVPIAAISAAPVAFPLGAVVALPLLSILWGALARMAAIHAGRDGRLSPFEGAAFARARAVGLASIPLLPLALLALLAAVIAVFALLLRIPVVGAVAGLLLVIPLAVALLGAILGLVALVALPIMPAALAVEDCDAGDAITRAAALVLGRPLLVAGSLAASVAALALGAAIVGTAVGVADASFAALASRIGGDVGRALASRDPAEIASLGGAARLTASLAGFWISVLSALPAAYLVSLAADLSTRLYLLLRARADGEPPATIAGHGLG